MKCGVTTRYGLTAGAVNPTSGLLKCNNEKCFVFRCYVLAQQKCQRYFMNGRKVSSIMMSFLLKYPVDAELL